MKTQTSGSSAARSGLALVLAALAIVVSLLAARALPASDTAAPAPAPAPVAAPAAADPAAPAPAAPAPPAAQDKPAAAANPWGPDVIVLDELQHLYKPVPFDHRNHAQMAEMWSGCVTCHHRSPENGAHADNALPTELRHSQDQSTAVPACKSCHPAEGGDIDIHMPGLKGAYHRQCLNCHREWTGENQCVICHEPADGKDGQRPPTRDDITGRMHPPIKAPAEKAYLARFTPVAGPNVLFRHDEHVSRFGLRCVECHRQDTCSSCHSPGAQAGQHKLLQSAWNWEKSHDPCLGCHAQHRCEHCHYQDGAAPPPPFEHQATGQLLDEKHKDLNCRQCHGDAAFATTPTCGDASCHPKNPSIAFPAQRPGPQTGITLTARRRPDAPATPRRTFPVLVPRDPAQAPAGLLAAFQTGKLVMRVDLPTRAPWVRQPSANVTTPQKPEAHAPQQPVPPDRRAPKPTTAPESPADCTSAQCHADLKTYAFVHGPVAQDGCNGCHELVDPAQHQFKLLRQREAMCNYCHEPAGTHLPVVHKPVELGECLSCHNPHGGADHSLTREASLPQLCHRCHDSVNTQAFLHTPVSQGQCLSCHAPHGALLPNLLDAAGAQLCVTCHVDFDRTLQDATFLHEALKDGCERCHDVHGSNHPLALQDDMVPLCQSCHEPVKQQMTAATYDHRVTSDERSCMNCHTPHGGTQTALMLDTEARLCMTCHNKPQDAGDGRVVAATPEIADPATFKHAPVGEGQCSGCHAPHGGERPSLMVADYARNFYNPYSEEAYALCFTCHQAKAMRSLRDTENTQFRNGDLNLHYVHVQGPRGRSCDVCHSPHASTAPMVVRQQVHYRTWTFAIDFRKSDTGGSCSPGCHLPLRYDRVEAVATPTSLMTARQEAANVRAEQRAPTSVRWLGQDVRQQPVRVPEAQQVTLLIFVRPDARNNADLFRLLEAAMHDVPDVQTIVVVGSPAPGEIDPAQQQAQRDALLALLPKGWRLVEDTEAALAGQTDLHGWPTTLVINPDGLQIARLGGSAPSLALKIRGYLPSRPGDPAAQNAVVSGGADTQVRLRLQIARNLVEHGKVDDAVQLISEALALQPQSATLQVALIDVLAGTPRAGEALQRLDALPADSAPPPRVAVLRARALLSLGRHDEALALLQATTAKPDAPAESFYLLGQALEKAGRWQDAAAAYRAAAQRR